jgi:hypothetical protein
MAGGRAKYFVPSYSTFFDTTCPFVCVFMCTKHKTPNKSHSWLAPLGSLCLARVRVRPLTLRLALRARDTGRRGEGGGRGARFARLASLGLLRMARFAWLASLGSLRSAHFARLASLGSLRSARVRLRSPSLVSFFGAPTQASPKIRVERGALASSGRR